jgi:phosphodiesterase/alkaline phosphatase D-like protein
MPQLVIGHTTSDSAWIWVRGGRKARRAKVEIQKPDGAAVTSREVKLDASRDYTAVARFDSELAPDAPYQVLAHFGKRRTAPLRGELRTFPRPGNERAFHFLHGSCNLPTARLTALGSMAIGLIGGVAAGKSLERSVEEWDTNHWPWWLPESLLFRRIYRRLGSLLAHWVPGAIAATTRYQQPKPLLPSPFEELAEMIENHEPADRPAFMIHAGDQIYFDVDFPARAAHREEYRRNYRQAWFEDEPTARLLRSLPHYMILDDHEILDSFGTDPDEREREHLAPALEAYGEYVGTRQPSEPGRRYYSFQHGSTHFFVLDTRSERSVDSGEMIDNDPQMKEFENWLCDHPGELKFVVSSVPFVAQLRPPGLGRREDEQADKWSGRAWRRQRERILAAIYEHEVERLVFLVGDMHCAYHATLRVGPPIQRFTVHELAGGPIHQLLFARRDDFYARYSSTFSVHEGKRNEAELPWSSTLEAFHGAAPSVLRISVTPETEDDPLEVGWEVVRTRTKAFRREEGDRSRAPAATDPAPLRNRIRFHHAPGANR